MNLTDRLNYAKMKARHQKILLPWYKKRWGIIILILLGLLLIQAIFSAFYIFSRIQEIKEENNRAQTEAVNQAYLNSINGDGSNYYLGLSASDVTNLASSSKIINIVEFSNFSCFYSALSAPAAKKMAEEFKDQIRIVYRDYPDQDSIILSLGARCAGEQGKFWELHDMLFEYQDDISSLQDESKRRDTLLQMAEVLKLDTTKFTDCLDNKKYLSQVRKDYEDGEKLGVEGTPTWFVNNYEITGALEEDNFRKMISGLIK